MSAMQMRANLMTSQRILVVGAPGSGKTKFAQQLAAKTGLPLLSLDDIYWAPGWRRVPQSDFIREQKQFLSQQRWIIDGLHMPSLPLRVQHADAIVIIDVSAWVALSGFLWRGLLRRCGSRASLPGRMREHQTSSVVSWFAEWRPEWKILKTILSFRTQHAPAIVEMAQKLPSATGGAIPILRLNSRYECKRLLEECFV